MDEDIKDSIKFVLALMFFIGVIYLLYWRYTECRTLFDSVIFCLTN